MFGEACLEEASELDWVVSLFVDVKQDFCDHWLFLATGRHSPPILRNLILLTVINPYCGFRQIMAGLDK